jgi:DNA-binding transcriptional LysR family regulator
MGSSNRALARPDRASRADLQSPRRRLPAMPGIVVPADCTPDTAIRRDVAPRYRLTRLRFHGLPRLRTIGVSCRKSGYLSPAARRIIEMLKKTAGKIAAGN